MVNTPNFKRSTIVVSVLSALAVGGTYYNLASQIEELKHTQAKISVDAPKVSSINVANDKPYQQVVMSQLPDFSSIVEAEGAAVVNISVSATIKSDFNGRGFNFQPFRQFMPQFPQMPDFDTPDEFKHQGQGSGFIIDKEGYILTNAHVVDRAEEVIVKLADKREFKAKVLGTDKTSDIAVIKIDAENLPTVKIGDPKQSKVGEWVLAIGTPYGFDNTATAGIISAKSRALPEGYVPFIQTDVAINPGNSGGPLFNLKGEVIGINSQIYSRSGGYQGLSFAIPMDIAMSIEKQLVSKGKVSRGQMGVNIQRMDQSLAESFGLDKPKGALVAAVVKNSPAEKAGIEAGDIILKFNGQEIESSEDLPIMVATVPLGEEVSVEVWHKKEAKILKLKTAEISKPEELAGKAFEGQKDDKLGITVRSLSADEKEKSGVAQGVMVLDVEAGLGLRAGLRKGDVILSVNNQEVTSPETLKSLADKSGRSLALLIARGNSRIFVSVTL